MELETVEKTRDSDGKQILKAKGRSLEYILDARLARGTMADLTTSPKWVLTGLPKAVATQMFHDICVTGILNAGDVIPLIHEGTLFPPDTNPFPTGSITIEVDPSTLYSAIKNVCDLFSMGFRLIKNGDSGELWFDIYAGSDRTMRQTTLPAVIFSSEFGNLQNTTELTSSALYKNVAYVISPVGSEVVYAQDVDPAVSGFQRKMIMVKADDIKDTVPADATAKMIQRGMEELAKNRMFSAFDGEISHSSQYKYGVDYNLGDLVELQNEDGAMSDMRVTEQIFVSDPNGDRSYPTLVVDKFIPSGSWLSQPPAKEWLNFTTEQWDDM
jgi:hypothetical protein